MMTPINAEPKCGVWPLSQMSAAIQSTTYSNGLVEWVIVQQLYLKLDIELCSINMDSVYYLIGLKLGDFSFR